MVKQFDGKVNLNISGVVNPNIPDWQFNAILPTYQVLDISNSLKENKFVVSFKQFIGNNSFFDTYLGIGSGSKQLKAVGEFVKLVNNGTISQIPIAVKDYLKKTKYNVDKFTSSLKKVIEEKITVNKLSTIHLDKDTLSYLYEIIYWFFIDNKGFYSGMYDILNSSNKHNFEKLIGKNFNAKWYDYILLGGVPAVVKGVYSEIQDYQFGKDFIQLETYNSTIYNNLPKNESFFDYLLKVGVPQDDINAFAQEEAEKENNTGNKKGTGKTTTNSNITPILIGVGIIALVIYLKKRRK